MRLMGANFHEVQFCNKPLFCSFRMHTQWRSKPKSQMQLHLKSKQKKMETQQIMTRQNSATKEETPWESDLRTQRKKIQKDIRQQESEIKVDYQFWLFNNNVHRYILRVKAMHKYDQRPKTSNVLSRVISQQTQAPSTCSSQTSTVLCVMNNQSPCFFGIP